ncbi:MAG: sodium/proton-translocating pyrophosphatase [Ferruginibacter sp.]
MGDPFKDTSGPSMNILIKLMSIVSLVIAPTLATIRTNNASIEKAKETAPKVVVTKSTNTAVENAATTAKLQ